VDRFRSRPVQAHASLLATVLLGLLTAVAVLLPPGGGASATERDRVWPRPIAVYRAPAYAAQLEAAVGAWNRSGVAARFVLVDDKRAADVIVVASDAALQRACGPGKKCIGYATRVGYYATLENPVRLYLPSRTRERAVDALSTLTIAHELGHVLGLDHVEGCSIMNERPTARTCPQKKLWPTLRTYLCGPLAADVDAALALYGGRRAPGYSPLCERD
jgi:hypothetical protein